MSEQKRYPIRYVARQTGLTPHSIRSWERRYEAVVPQRTETNRRLYSDEDIERLNLLNNAVKAGNSIAQIASLGKMELRKIAPSRGDLLKPAELRKAPAPETPLPVRHYEACLDAVTRFDLSALEHALNSAAVELNHINLLSEVVVPVIQQIGELWSDGTIRIYQEHAASSALHTFLGDLLRFADIQPSAPTMVVATPAGQHHELGALVVAVAAAYEGWRVTYLGANLPFEEIAGAAGLVQPKMVCLSLVFPADDPKVIFEIKRLRRYLPKNTRLIIGGKAAGAYAVHLEAADAEVIQNIADFFSVLKAASEDQTL